VFSNTEILRKHPDDTLHHGASGHQPTATSRPGTHREHRRVGDHPGDSDSDGLKELRQSLSQSAMAAVQAAA